MVLIAYYLPLSKSVCMHALRRLHLFTYVAVRNTFAKHLSDSRPFKPEDLLLAESELIIVLHSWVSLLADKPGILLINTRQPDAPHLGPCLRPCNIAATLAVA